MDNSQAVDMDTTEALNRKIRLKLLLDEGLQIENDIPDQTSEQTLKAIRKIITTSDDIIGEGDVQERKEHTTEVVMDAQVLRMNHELVSKVMLQSSEFNDRMYHNALAAIVFRDDNDESTDNWTAITAIAVDIALTARTKSSMLGAIEAQRKESVVKERQQRKKTALAAEQQPLSIENLKRTDRGAKKINVVHEQVAQIFKANHRQPIPFYKLIIDPENFMNSVENAFQMAFLARDSIIAIETGDDSYPQVRLATADERKENESDTSQSICTLNMRLCQEMTLFYNITEPMLRVQADEEDE